MLEAAYNQTGEVFGIIYNDTVLVTGLNFDSTVEASSDEENSRLYNRNIYPAGMDWCGMFQIRKSPFSIEEKQFFSRLEVFYVFAFSSDV